MSLGPIVSCTRLSENKVVRSENLKRKRTTLEKKVDVIFGTFFGLAMPAPGRHFVPAPKRKTTPLNFSSEKSMNYIAETPALNAYHRIWA